MRSGLQPTSASHRVPGIDPILPLLFLLPLPHAAAAAAAAATVVGGCCREAIRDRVTEAVAVQVATSGAVPRLLQLYAHLLGSRRAEMQAEGVERGPSTSDSLLRMTCSTLEALADSELGARALVANGGATVLGHFFSARSGKVSSNLTDLATSPVCLPCLSLHLVIRPTLLLVATARDAVEVELSSFMLGVLRRMLFHPPVALAPELLAEGAVPTLLGYIATEDYARVQARGCSELQHCKRQGGSNGCVSASRG